MRYGWPARRMSTRRAPRVVDEWFAAAIEQGVQEQYWPVVSRLIGRYGFHRIRWSTLTTNGETYMDGPINEMSPEELATRVGTPLGTSDWFDIDQKTIDTFADLTHDHYFIHVDPKTGGRRARSAGPSRTVSCTLSMLAPMAYQACPVVKGSKTNVNYGFNRMRFVAPVRSGSRVRGHFVLKSFDIRPADAGRRSTTSRSRSRAKLNRR